MAKMQGAVAAKTPDEALNECVAAMMKAAQMRLAQKDEEGETEDVQEWLRKVARPQFVEQFEKWPPLETKVKESSGAIGQVAAILAKLGARKTIGKKALSDAIKAVNNHCQAVDATKRGPRPDYVFCPKLP